MNWEMLSAIGSILGAITVVATLAYLAKQIRASTRATQHAAAQDLLNGARLLLGEIGSSPQVSRIWRLGLAGEELTPDELVQFRVLVMQMTYDWMRVYHLAKEGTVESWMYESNIATRRDIVGAPGFQQWYAIRKNWLSAEFRKSLKPK